MSERDTLWMLLLGCVTGIFLTILLAIVIP